MTVSPAVPALDGLAPGEHVCLLCATPDDLTSALVSAIEGGLRSGEYVLYIGAGSSERFAAVTAAIAAHGLGVRNDHLFVEHSRDWWEEGLASPKTFVRNLEQLRVIAAAFGFHATRVVGEMTWMEPADRERVAALELALGGWATRSGATLACCYQASRVSVPEAISLAHTHSSVVEADHGGWVRSDNRRALAAEENVRITTAFLDAVLGSEAAPILLLGPEGEILSANALARSLLSLPDDAIRLADHLVPAQRERLAEAVATIARTGQPQNLVTTLADAQGRFRHVQWNLAPARHEWATGQLVCVGADHTEREESRNFLQGMIDSLPIPVFYKDAAGSRLECNRSFRDFLSGEGAPEQAAFDLAARFEKEDRALLESGGPQRFEYEYASPRGPRHLLFHRVVFHQPSGAPAGIIGTVIDETAERRAKEALARETERLSVTIEAISEAVVSTDTQGRVILFNPAAEKLTGFLHSEIADRGFLDAVTLLDPDTGKRLEQLEELAHGSSRLLTLVSRDGLRHLVHLNAAPLSPFFDSSLYAVLVFQDVTERHRVEERQKLSWKMESIGQLAAGIAHEINTPMQYVGDNVRFLESSFVQILEVLRTVAESAKEGATSAETVLQVLRERVAKADLDFLVTEIPASVRDALDGIERVTKIILAMKDFTHPSSNEKTLSDLNQGIAATATISRNAWKYVADLTTELDPALPQVLCNLDEINQVVLNMVLNAADAIRDTLPSRNGAKGAITLVTRQVEGAVQVVVRDDGPGIPEAIRHRIFDPFFTTKEVGKGTGQGLAIAHDIVVNKHGGRIDLESNAGGGAAFVITLPLAGGQG